jgi:acetylornithine/succinyldiaminopimelate/putrescine aminotransferase
VYHDVLSKYLLGLKTLQLLAEDEFSLIKEVKEKGNTLLSLLREVQKKYPHIIKEVRGRYVLWLVVLVLCLQSLRGFLIGIEFDYVRKQLHLEQKDSNEDFLMGVFSEQGVFAAVLSSYLLNVEYIRVAVTLNASHTLRIEPPLIASREMCTQMAQVNNFHFNENLLNF